MLDSICDTRFFYYISEISQVIFWLGTPVIAFITYRQAKKTIFSGARGEVFKKQMEEINEILEFLDEKQNFDYDRHDKASRICLINVFMFFLNNFRNINTDDVENIKHHIEKNKKKDEKFYTLYPDQEAIFFTNDKSRIVLKKTYCIFDNHYKSKSRLSKYENNIFLPRVIRDEIKSFIKYEEEKETYIIKCLEGLTFIHKEIESNAFKYAIEIYRDFYKKYSENYNSASDGADKIRNTIKEYLKVDELIR